MELKTRVDREEALALLGHRGQELGDLRERLERAACLCVKELVPRVVLLAVTLGTQSEMLLRRERALSATDGLLADACASSLVEQAANVLNAHIVEEAAARNLAATSRFSPGYGDLPLSCQPAFLAASGADRALGIHATAAHLLVPTKSITAVIGLRSHPNSAREGGASTAPTEGMRCSTCPLADTCALRAQGRTCYGNPA